MYIFKKILIILIIIIFLYILSILLNKRSHLAEGFTDQTSNIIAEVGKMNASTETGISSVSKNNVNLPLREYCIKSSYNSALSGTVISTSAIKYVLSRGCRFLDFEIFFIDNSPCVAYSTDPNFISITSVNYITLNNAFETIITNAFSAPSPNVLDPVFIQLRIKSNNPKIYSLIGMSVYNYLNNKLYAGTVTGNTILNDLMGKFVLIIDKTISPGYSIKENYPNCINNINDVEKSGCYNLSSFKNMESGTQILRLYTYDNLLKQVVTPPLITDTDNLNTDVSLLRIIEPSQYETNNPLCSDFILNYGVQFIVNRFYLLDNNLEKYELFFNANHSAFVPFATAIRFYK
jgi:hypothetical protein